MEVRAATLGVPPCFSDSLPFLPAGQSRQSRSPHTAKAPEHPRSQGGGWTGARRRKEACEAAGGVVSGAAPHGLGLRELLGATPGGGKEAERLRHTERERSKEILKD